MNKRELTEKLAVRTGLSRRAAATAVDAIFGASRRGILAAELTRGHKVTISGFGSFEVRKRKARNGRNPRSGEAIVIDATRFPAFRAGKGLKETVRR